jgi:hypothetical protein
MWEDNMEPENIGHISDIPLAASVNESKIKDEKKTTTMTNGRKCIYFKDMVCRIPVCDMKACEKCSEGSIYCTRVNFIKSLIQKVLMVFIGILIFSE